jgi:hypothetical protein
MLISTVAFTSSKSSEQAGIDLSQKIQKDLQGNIPGVVILFASSEYNYEEILTSLSKHCTPEILIGCSSAGEFTSTDFDINSASAVALYSTEIIFSAGLGIGIKENRKKATDELYRSLTGIGDFDYPFHSGLILADALSGHTDEIIDMLTERTITYQFFGGGAGDNANFQKTHVFFGNKAYTDAAVILEILSKKPLGIGVKHGWLPTGEKMRVTASEGMKLISLNGIPAKEIFLEYAETTNQELDTDHPIPFFLHNILGIETAQGYKLRVPLSIHKDGSLTFASDIPTGAILSFMAIHPEASKNAAQEAAAMAIENIQGSNPGVALFFDCVATRLRLGKNFENELEQVKNTLQGIKYAGCNTYGQIARVNGQFSGFHNCTAVVCIIPE